MGGGEHSHVDLDGGRGDAYMAFRGQLQDPLGSVELNHFVARSEHALSAYVESDGTWYAIHINVQPEEPHKIVGLLVQPTDPPEGPDRDDGE